MQAARAYKKRGGGDRWGFARASYLMVSYGGGYLLPDSVTRSMTVNGFGWGDNPGDALNIMKGWDHADAYY